MDGTQKLPGTSKSLFDTPNVLSIFRKDITIEIDLLIASEDDLYQIPGIDRATAKFIETERSGASTS